MTLLLTGASGFVGGHVQRATASQPFDRDGREIDVRDAGAVAAAVAEMRPDTIIHLAAQSFVPASFNDPRQTFDINFLGTLHLLQALKASGFRGRMLYVGSGDTYGLVSEADLPVRESQPLRPRSPYSVSKVAAEALCYQWSQTEGIDIVMARPFNHIGPGQSPQFAVSDFARQVVEIQLKRREPLLQVGDVDATRDFTDVRDVVSAYLLLLQRGRRGETYNVCSGKERSLRSVLVRLLELAGVETRIEIDAARLRQAEQRRIFGSNEKLRSDTGWQPAIAFDQTLSDILTYWKEQLT
jgi:GDP-4-dehydro-6-deoxy-D-mannose reductase